MAFSCYSSKNPIRNTFVCLREVSYLQGCLPKVGWHCQKKASEPNLSIKSASGCCIIGITDSLRNAVPNTEVAGHMMNVAAYVEDLSVHET